MKRLRLMSLAMALLIVTGASAQEPERQPQPPQPPAQGARVQGARGPVTPLEVQVTISRYQGEKKISTMPYVLAVNANSTDAQLTLNVDVPVATTTFSPTSDDKLPQPAGLTSFNYKSVGTNIVCGATTADDGRFEITIGVDETSVVPSSEGQVGTRPGMPAFRNFKSRNRLLLRDGQTRQYTAATDRISGETVRVDVMLKVVK